MIKTGDGKFGFVTFAQCDTCGANLGGRSSSREALGDAVLARWHTVYNDDETFTHVCAECLEKEKELTHSSV